jgi:hypothetical protein
MVARNFFLAPPGEFQHFAKYTAFIRPPARRAAVSKSKKTMKPTLKLRSFLLACGSLLVVSTAHAADVTWDVTPGTVGAGDSAVTGGAGTWATTNGNWTTDGGINNVAWSNGNNDTAIFGNTAGTVTLGTDINVSGMEFTSGGYILEGGGNSIILGNNGGVRGTNTPGPSLYSGAGSGTTTINADIDTNGFFFTVVGENATASIVNGVISGSGNFAAHTASNVTLSGANTYTGKTFITSDSTAGSSLSVSSFNSVNGGTPLLTSSSLGAPTTVANGTIDVGPTGKRSSTTLTYTGSGEVTDRVLKVGFNSSSIQTINASGNGLLKFTSAMTTNASSGNSGALRLGGTGDGEFAQALPDFANTGGVDKRDAGTWTLAGGTISKLTVTGGTLINNGTFNVTTSVTVNNNTTLSAGYIIANSASLGATSNTVMELGGSTLGTGYDNITLDAAGTLVYGGDLSIVNLGLYDMDAASFTYDLFAFDTMTPNGNLASVTVNSVSLTNSLGVWSGTNGGVSYAFDQSDGDLSITAIPEPSAAALLGALGAMLLLRRRLHYPLSPV